jgi:hypothetical protein
MLRAKNNWPISKSSKNFSLWIYRGSGTRLLKTGLEFGAQVVGGVLIVNDLEY